MAKKMTQKEYKEILKKVGFESMGWEDILLMIEGCMWAQYKDMKAMGFTGDYQRTKANLIHDALEERGIYEV